MYVKIYIYKGGSLRGIPRRNKKVLQKVDIAEALTKHGVPNAAYQHMVTPKSGSSEGNSVESIGESLEYENIQTETKLEGGGGDKEWEGWHEIVKDGEAGGLQW